MFYIKTLRVDRYIYASIATTYSIAGGGGEARQRACCGHIIGTSMYRVKVFRLFFAYILKIMAEGSPLAQWKYKLYTKMCWFIIMYGFRGLRSTIVCINRELAAVGRWEMCHFSGGPILCASGTYEHIISAGIKRQLMLQRRVAFRLLFCTIFQLVLFAHT